MLVMVLPGAAYRLEEPGEALGNNGIHHHAQCAPQRSHMLALSEKRESAVGGISSDLLFTFLKAHLILIGSDSYSVFPFQTEI